MSLTDLIRSPDSDDKSRIESVGWRGAKPGSEAVLLGDRICVMSGTPGRTRAVFDVDLPRPRELEIEDTVEFAHLKRRVREALEEVHQ